MDESDYEHILVVGAWLVQAVSDVIPTCGFIIPSGDNYIKSCHEIMFSACLLFITHLEYDTYTLMHNIVSDCIT